ncbi:MAG: TonB family protein [Chitinophagales bacterium]
MKTTTFYFTLYCLFLLCSPNAFSYSLHEEHKNNDTQSPYFFIETDEQGNEKMPLKSTDVHANIAGVMADVCIKQVYQNTGKTPIEAIYVFPLGTRAAVYGMEMYVGERVITAKIEEKNKAKQAYTTAKKQGKRAALLEQERPNVFQMQVANIMPNETVEVHLSYTELLVPKDGRYEFVYPAVVGPRYGGEKIDEQLTASSETDNWVANPYLEEGKNSNTTLNITTHINAGLPIQAINCKSYETKTSYLDTHSAIVSLNKKEQKQGNKDYILEYELKGKQIESGVLLYENGDENFFLSMIQPPKNIGKKQIVPREYIFVIDISGSMNGFPLDVSKSLMTDLFQNLKSTDKFNILFFAGGSNVLSEQSLNVTTANVTKAQQWLSKQNAGGGTNLFSAVKRAFQLPKAKHFSRSMVVITDGYISVEKEVFDFIGSNLNESNVFAFGIGSSVNRHLIEGMAHVGQGEAFIVTSKNEAKQKAKALNTYIEQPVLSNIRFEFKDFEAYEVAQKSIPDLFSERPILIFGKYKGEPKGEIVLKGNIGKQKYEKHIRLKKMKADAKNKALRYLWAKEKIRHLDDYKTWTNNKEHEIEMVALGMQYNLLTAYTSFVAIDEEIANKNGNPTSVKQPLPLPAGVSNMAISNAQKSMMPPPPPPIRFAPQEDAEIGDVEEEAEEIILEEPTLATDEVQQEEIFSVVEEMPEYEHGQDALLKFIAENMVYPKEAIDAGIEGKVFVKFTIEKDGSMSNIHIVRGLHEALDAEALRVVSALPGSWKAGKQRGKLVRVQYTLPIMFKLKG